MRLSVCEGKGASPVLRLDPVSPCAFEQRFKRAGTDQLPPKTCHFSIPPMCLRTFSMSSTRSHVVFSFSSAGGNDSPDPRWSTRTMPVCGDMQRGVSALRASLRREDSSETRKPGTDGTPPDRSAVRPCRHIHLPDRRARTRPAGPARIVEGERCQSLRRWGERGMP